MVFYESEAQREAAEASRAALAQREGIRIATPVEALPSFTRAEDYHQKYYLRHSGQVFEELRPYYDDERAFTDARAAARLNGYLGGHGTLAQFDEEAPGLGLSPEALALVRTRVQATDASCQSE